MTTQAAAAAAVLLVAACGGTEDSTADAPATVDTPGLKEPEAESPEESSWSYEGETGPANWAELEADYATCAAGERQSPVDLPAPADAAQGEAAVVTYDYQPAAYEVVDTGHTIQADAGSSAGGITVAGEDYELLQFHAHAPSEHAFAGERTDLEVHLVHQNAAGELAVVGVLVEEGESSSALAEAWADLPTGEQTVSVADFDAGTLLPEDRTTYQYEGSLTTPPCTEGVQWLVMQETATAPAEVITGFEEAVGESARPLQPLNEREPVLGQPAG
ncbi:carbonic anhydrase [Blastococcus capsensis]|uniref:carbonic anhydrase n=1 Tax=Blastococcus capsensis TaxID=1564163 RepID=UPI00253F87BA|nr:carbonic anhydrase family protein [Blastococcus capsensis]MDK3256074.1 carbonic anhydrase family protein [Blastococcus capsensis]